MFQKRPDKVIVECPLTVSCYVPGTAFSIIMRSESCVPFVKVTAVGHNRPRSPKLNKVTQIFAGIRFAQFQLISCLGNHLVFFPVVKSVDFCAPNAKYIHQSVRSSSQITPVRIVHDSGPACCDKHTARFHKSADLFRKSFFEHIHHRQCQNPVLHDVTVHVHQIHIQPLPAEASVKFQKQFQIMKILVSRSLAVLHRPLTVPVIQNGSFAVHRTSGKLRDFFQCPAGFAYFFEHPGIISTIVVNDRTVEFLGSASALAHLEVESALPAMRNCLHGLCEKNPWSFQLAHALPVRRRWAGFHLEKWFSL